MEHRPPENKEAKPEKKPYSGFAEEAFKLMQADGKLEPSDAIRATLTRIGLTDKSNFARIIENTLPLLEELSKKEREETDRSRNVFYGLARKINGEHNP